MSRHITCEHDKIFSGQLRVSDYAWICRKCGNCGWSHEYDLSRVNMDEYHALRVLHGWATPQKLPPPPRMPSVVSEHPREAEHSLFRAPMLLFAFLFTLIGASGLPLGPHGESALPLWAALMGSGLALSVFTFCYVAWKKGF